MTRPFTAVDKFVKHANAMNEITAALRGFSREDQMVMVCGVLGNILSEIEVGNEPPSKTSAILLSGTAMNMVIDMIGRHFNDRGEAA